jgi:hypothetical protein
MDAGANILVVHLVRTLVGFGITALVILTLASLVFPSTRAALADLLRGRRKHALDSDAVLEQLAIANAQLSALRGEVYALRCEVAAVHSLRAELTPASLPLASTAPRVS